MGLGQMLRRDGTVLTNSGDSLGDGDRKCKSNNLAQNIRPDLTSAYFEKRLVPLDESLLAEEEEQFLRDAVAFDGTPLYLSVPGFMDPKIWSVTYPNNEKYAGEQCTRHGLKDNQKWACHRTDDSEAHEEMRDPLFHDFARYYHGLSDLGFFIFAGSDNLQLGFIDC